MRGILVLLVCALLLAVAAPVSPLPPPDGGDDDAGSGGDAWDREQAEFATPIEPGTTYTGRVGWDVGAAAVAVGFFWEYDPRDVYRFHVPANTTVRADVVVPEEAFENETFLDIILTGPDGRWRNSWLGGPDRLDPPSPSGNVTMVAVRPGTWMLTVRDVRSPGPVPYEFAVTLDRFDHGAILDGGGADIAAWEAEFPEGVRGRLNFWLDPALHGDGLGDQQLYGISLTQFPSRDKCSIGVRATTGAALEERLGRTGVNGGTVAWAEGVVEEDVTSPVDATGWLPLHDGWSFGGERVAPRHSDRPLRFGVAYQHGVGEVAFIVWDGNEPPIIERKEATAEFLTLEDFEAEDEGGFGAQVGPAAYAERFSLERDIADRPGNVVLVDAIRPAIGPYVTSLHAPTIDVALPNGSTQRVHDDWFFWEPLPRSFPWRGDQHVPPGTWRFDLDRVDGLEGDQVRVMLLSFGFEFDCD